MSRVKQFVADRIEVIVREQSMPAKWKERRVTVRLTPLQYGALLLLIQRMSGSVTGCAEAILTEALRDALEAIGYASYDDARKDILDALEADIEQDIRRSVNMYIDSEDESAIRDRGEINTSSDSEDAASGREIHTEKGNTQMNETELYNLLGKIGKRIFVQYFADFGNPNISNQDIIARLPSEYTATSRASRTSKSRRIFREGLERKALSLIVMSNRVEPETAIQARALLGRLGQ
jgi:hypothetical protein